MSTTHTPSPTDQNAHNLDHDQPGICRHRPCTSMARSKTNTTKASANHMGIILKTHRLAMQR